jgi:hypothetical protein
MQEPAPPYVLRGEPESVPIENALVYSNKTAWYPQGSSDDYALARIRFEVPAGFAALTGGARVMVPADEGRSVFEYRQTRPGKYITAVVGRLQESLSRDAGSLRLEAFGVSRLRSESARQIEKALEILRYFEGEFGPYPYDSLRLAMIEGRAPGGHSPPGMIVLASRPLHLRARTTTPSATCRGSSSPTSWPTSGGVMAWRARTTGNAGWPRGWPSTRRPCGPATVWARRPFVAC